MQEGKFAEPIVNIFYTLSQRIRSIHEQADDKLHHTWAGRITPIGFQVYPARSYPFKELSLFSERLFSFLIIYVENFTYMMGDSRRINPGAMITSSLLIFFLSLMLQTIYK